MTRDGPRSGVSTTERSLEIVAAVQRLEGATLATVSEEVGLARSTAFKHLVTLVRRGYLVKEGERYHVGLKFHHRGEYARLRKPAYRLAGEAVRDLAERTSEEVDFVVENDGRAITIHESYHPSNPYRDDLVRGTGALSRSGTYYHMHCVGGGKAILAAFPPERVEGIVDHWGLPERTDRTITTEKALGRELETVRERGYATTDEEYAEGLRSIGVAVREPDGSVVGGLSMSVPTYRQTATEFEERAAPLIREAGEALERAIAEAGPGV